MTLPVWPVTINYLVERDSVQLTPNEPMLRSEFDYGPARMRRRFTRQVAKAQLSIVMNSEEFEVFKGFWAHTLENGAAWFQMSIWSGDSYRAHRVRFTEPFTGAYYAHAHMRVEGKLEVLELFTLDADMTDILSVYTGAQLLEMGNVVDFTVNTHWGTTWR